MLFFRWWARDVITCPQLEEWQLPYSVEPNSENTRAHCRFCRGSCTALKSCWCHEPSLQPARGWSQAGKGSFPSRGQIEVSGQKRARQATDFFFFCLLFLGLLIVLLQYWVACLKCSLSGVRECCTLCLRLIIKFSSYDWCLPKLLSWGAEAWCGVISVIHTHLFQTCS